jgi:hypothetical protein
MAWHVWPLAFMCHLPCTVVDVREVRVNAGVLIDERTCNMCKHPTTGRQPADLSVGANYQSLPTIASCV